MCVCGLCVYVVCVCVSVRVWSVNVPSSFFKLSIIVFILIVMSEPHKDFEVL